MVAHPALLQTAGGVRRQEVGALTGPSPIAVEQAQRQQRVDLLARPMHPRPLHPRRHHGFVGALCRSTADRPPLLAKGRIGELDLPLAQVGHVLAHGGLVALPVG